MAEPYRGEGIIGGRFQTLLKNTSSASSMICISLRRQTVEYLAQASYDQDEGLDVNNKAVVRESQQRIDFDWGQSL